MSLQIAQAAVDDATIHFDKLYSYCIPPRLNDKVWPGSMVLVPFGRGNKPRMAVVLSVAELPEGADTQKLKTLYDAAPAEARLTPDLLELVRFLKDRTFCTWFEAVKAVIPYGAQYRAAVENGRPVMQNRLSRSTERLYTLAGELPAKPKAWSASAGCDGSAEHRPQDGPPAGRGGHLQGNAGRPLQKGRAHGGRAG